jgi:hypothetical protein
VVGLHGEHEGRSLSWTDLPKEGGAVGGEAKAVEEEVSGVGSVGGEAWKRGREAHIGAQLVGQVDRDVVAWPDSNGRT